MLVRGSIRRRTADEWEHLITGVKFVGRCCASHVRSNEELPCCSMLTRDDVKTGVISVVVGLVLFPKLGQNSGQGRLTEVMMSLSSFFFLFIT